MRFSISPYFATSYFLSCPRHYHLRNHSIGLIWFRMWRFLTILIPFPYVEIVIWSRSVFSKNTVVCGKNNSSAKKWKKWTSRLRQPLRPPSPWFHHQQHHRPNCWTESNWMIRLNNINSGWSHHRQATTIVAKWAREGKRYQEKRVRIVERHMHVVLIWDLASDVLPIISRASIYHRRREVGKESLFRRQRGALIPILRRLLPQHQHSISILWFHRTHCNNNNNLHSIHLRNRWESSIIRRWRIVCHQAVTVLVQRYCSFISIDRKRTHSSRQQQLCSITNRPLRAYHLLDIQKWTAICTIHQIIRDMSIHCPLHNIMAFQQLILHLFVWIPNSWRLIFQGMKWRWSFICSRHYCCPVRSSLQHRE